MVELTGIIKGTGAKMKVDIGETNVTFRGALKATVPFGAVDAEARGTLLVLRYQEHVIELAAAKKALPLAQKIQRGG